MATLNFTGPYHKSLINSLTGIKSSGVYIGGFTAKRISNWILFEDFSNPLTHIPNNSLSTQYEQVFIPYYVGMSKSSIFDRLVKHINVRSGHAKKYTRLESGCISNVIATNIFSKEIGKNPTVPFSAATYFNNDSVLKQIYPGINPIPKGKDYPIDIQLLPNGKALPDPLEQLVVNMGNFSFLYCNNIAQIPLKIREIESFLFYSLKGYTISECSPLSQTITNIKNAMTLNGGSVIDINIPNSPNLTKYTDDITFIDLCTKKIITSNHPSNFNGDY
ncbi:MAG: hypothetical protein WCK78_06610 [Paludibacter sp.]